MLEDDPVDDGGEDIVDVQGWRAVPSMVWVSVVNAPVEGVVAPIGVELIALVTNDGMVIADVVKLNASTPPTCTLLVVLLTEIIEVVTRVLLD